jgi:Glycosyl transferase family 2
MRLAICAIIKNESQYLDEWIFYHKNLGIDEIFLYDNISDIPINRDDVYVKLWPDNNVGSQMRAYLNFCKEHPEFDYVAFIDIDEFIVCDNLRDFMKNLNADALAISWRFYGNNPPYLTRQPHDAYTMYHKNDHIKSFINPKVVKNMRDPHFAQIEGRYIDEKGNTVKGPLHPHTSEKIYIKHIYTRSLEEWKEKILRGSGDKVVRTKTIEDFYTYNKQCI